MWYRNVCNLSSVVSIANNQSLFHKSTYFVCQLEERQLWRSIFLTPQQPLKVLINKKKSRWTKMSCIHSTKSAPGCLYTTAQTMLVMHDILSSLQTNKALYF